MSTVIDYYDRCFENQNGKDFGIWVDRRFCRLVFNGLEEPDDVHHDKRWKGRRVEVKAIRAVSRKEKYIDPDILLESTFKRRKLRSVKNSHLHGLDAIGNKCRLFNLSFQQTKASEFDILIGFVFFLDLVRVYIVSADKISSNVDEKSNKIKIVNQHRNSSEGHLMLNKLSDYMVFEIREDMNGIIQRDFGDFNESS